MVAINMLLRLDLTEKCSGRIAQAGYSGIIQSPPRLAARLLPTPFRAERVIPVNVRYARDFRSNPSAIAADIEVPLPGGGTVPLGEVANVKLTRGPTSVRTENGQLAVYIYVDLTGRDLGGYVEDASRAVANDVKLIAKLRTSTVAYRCTGVNETF